MKPIELADREMEVMHVLWDRGSATVAEAREKLADPLAYTTVLTVLRTLEEKGFVRHEEEGRAYRYFPMIERHQVRRGAVGRLLERAFDGSAELLMAHLVAERGLSPTQIRRIRRLLDERLRRGDAEAP
jgi:predicted transcriptional regulator